MPRLTPASITKNAKCQMILALMLFVAAGSASASPYPPRPACAVKAEVQSITGNKVKIKVLEEKKTQDGYEKDWNCNFSKQKDVTIKVQDAQKKLIKKGSLISIELQDAGDETGEWINTNNLKIIK